MDGFINNWWNLDEYLIDRYLINSRWMLERESDREILDGPVESYIGIKQISR